MYPKYSLFSPPPWKLADNFYAEKLMNMQIAVLQLTNQISKAELWCESS